MTPEERPTDMSAEDSVGDENAEMLADDTDADAGNEKKLASDLPQEASVHPAGETAKPTTRKNGSKQESGVEFDIGKEVYEWAGALVNAIVTVVLIFAFVCGVFRVDGRSMLPTLEDEQYMLVSRLFYTPKTGDIVIFSKMDGHFINPLTGRESPLVKRVIGVEGDTVRIDYNENAVYVNDVKLDESYLASQLKMHPLGYEGITMQDMGDGRVFEHIVSEGCVFVMGDNRNDSRDSRDIDVQEVDRRYILGRLLLRITPLSKFGPVK